MGRMKTYLEIPYRDKEKAKALGAKFDHAGWYCPDGVDLMLFKRWLPRALQKWARLPTKKARQPGRSEIERTQHKTGRGRG